MSAATAANPVAILRRAALLAGLLAVIAGFLGMHILAGSHGLHAQASPPGSTSTSTAHAAGPAPSEQTLAILPGTPATAPPARSQSHGPVRGRTAPSVTPAAATVGGTQVPPSCVCQGGCAEKPAVHVGCTPSPAGASLSAPQPGTTLLAAQPWSAATVGPPVRLRLPARDAHTPGPVHQPHVGLGMRRDDAGAHLTPAHGRRLPAASARLHTTGVHRRRIHEGHDLP